MADVLYATREDLKEAAQIFTTAYANQRIDRALASASRKVEDLCYRKFYPTLATRSFTADRSDLLWLDEHEVLSVTSITNDGTALTGSDYVLEPDDGPPYERVDIDEDSAESFSLDQLAVVIVGLFGGHNEESQFATLSAEMDAADNTLTFSSNDPVGVGDVLRIESERIILTNRTMVDTTDDLAGNLTASNANQTVPVADGSGFEVGETILIDAERMLIVDILANDLIVERAYDGSTLAAHTSGADISSPRKFTVARAQLGTAAATHVVDTDIYRLTPPAMVRTLTLAEAMVILDQESAAWARTVGTGDNQREAAGRALKLLRMDVRDEYGRIPAPQGAAV